MKKKRYRGHYCRICDCIRPNEQFSAKGHKTHVCKKCSRMPKAEREAIEQTDEIFGYMRQRRISEKNVARLTELMASTDSHVAELALIVHEVACLRPHKRNRYKGLRRLRPALMDRLEETGLLLVHHA
jgi:hypothetical protein